jgi:hypothetical protein
VERGSTSSSRRVRRLSSHTHSSRSGHGAHLGTIEIKSSDCDGSRDIDEVVEEVKTLIDDTFDADDACYCKRDDSSSGKSSSKSK